MKDIPQHPLSVLFEDEHLLVVDKPSGLLSHPNPGGNGASILAVVAASGRRVEGGADPHRAGLVHRLDRDTSGVLILSKSQEAYDRLQAQFKAREVVKIYHLIAHGKVRRMEFTCKKPLGRHPRKRNTRVVDEVAGREAETRFSLLHQYPGLCSLWQARPLTGRTHQIRVHMTECGLSVLGDPHYSSHGLVQKLSGVDIPRTMLHCQRLEFTHPATGAALAVEAPYPADFRAMLALLEKGAG